MAHRRERAALEWGPGGAVTLQRLFSAVRPGSFLALGPSELPLAAPLAAERIEAAFGATLLRRPLEG